MQEEKKMDPHYRQRLGTLELFLLSRNVSEVNLRGNSESLCMKQYFSWKECLLNTLEHCLVSILHSQCLCWLYSMLIDWIAGGCPWRLPCRSASQGRTDKTAVMTSWGRKQLVAEQVIGHLVFACHLDISSPHRISQQVSRSLKVLQQHCLV